MNNILRFIIFLLVVNASSFSIIAEEPKFPLRSWGESFVPRSPAPARTLQVVPIAELNWHERIALCCLQGLVARKQPHIWLMRDEVSDRFWLDWHIKQDAIEGWETVDDWRSLFEVNASTYRGAILADPELYRGELIALNVAACEELILLTPSLAEDLGIEVKIDLRGRFKTYTDAMAWVWERYTDKLNHDLVDFRDPKLVGFATFDLAFQHRGLMFWLTGSQEASEQGVDAEKELALIEGMLKEMGHGGVSLGFPAGEKDFGIGEPQGVELLSRFGFALSVNNHVGNYSVLSGVIPKPLKKPDPLPTPNLDPTKIYVAMILSDGDNQILWKQFYKEKYFDHAAFGTFPLAFGVGPATYEMQPGLINWYYEHAKPNTEFIADVSGVGYIAPNQFGQEIEDKEMAWDSFLKRTNHLMGQMHLRSIRTVNGEDTTIKRYVDALPDIHSVFADMGRYSGREGIDQLTYQIAGKPVFRSVTSWRYGKDGFLREIREQVGEQRPAFVNGFVHCWTYSMDDLVRIQKQADDDIVFVTPSQLASLYLQATEDTNPD